LYFILFPSIENYQIDENDVLREDLPNAATVEGKILVANSKVGRPKKNNKSSTGSPNHVSDKKRKLHLPSSSSSSSSSSSYTKSKNCDDKENTIVNINVDGTAGDVVDDDNDEEDDDRRSSKALKQQEGKSVNVPLDILGLNNFTAATLGHTLVHTSNGINSDIHDDHEVSDEDAIFFLNKSAAKNIGDCLDESIVEINERALAILDSLPHSSSYLSSMKGLSGFTQYKDICIYVRDETGNSIRYESLKKHITIVYKIILYCCSMNSLFSTSYCIRDLALQCLGVKGCPEARLNPFFGVIKPELVDYLLNKSASSIFMSSFAHKILHISVHRIDSVKCQLTSFDGKTLPAFPYIGEESSATLVNTLQDIFDEGRANFNIWVMALDTICDIKRRGDDPSRADITNPLFILERCVQVCANAELWHIDSNTYIDTNTYC
jgi:hypothetical protein